MEQENGDLFVFAVIITILSIIDIIFAFILVIIAFNVLTFISFAFGLLVEIFYLAIFWTINGVSKKLNNLVNLLRDKDVISPKDTAIVEDMDKEYIEDVVYCKNCGYQLFEDDKECPNCHMQRQTKKDKNNRKNNL